MISMGEACGERCKTKMTLIKWWVWEALINHTEEHEVHPISNGETPKI